MDSGLMKAIAAFGSGAPVTVCDDANVALAFGFKVVF
jgi:hypothetical protein